MMPKASATPPWEGPGLATQEIQSRLELILASLQPPRPDIIAPAAQQSLAILTQLDQFLISQPPGSSYFQHSHKRLPPTGGFITQQAQLGGRQAEIDREEDEALARQNEAMERQERRQGRRE